MQTHKFGKDDYRTAAFKLKLRGLFLILAAGILILFSSGIAAAQEKSQMVRLSRIQIDSTLR